MGFIAKLTQANLFKKIIDAVKDLISEANWECSPEGIHFQAMDTSHVALVHLHLESSGFANFQCSKNVTLGLTIGNMAKILKCATNEDSITIKAEDNSDSIVFVFESEKKDKHYEFDLKLSNIDAESLSIPESEYSVSISMPANEFQKICKDMQQIGDTVAISATKQGVKFMSTGDIGSGSVSIRQNASADKKEDAIVIDMNEPVSLTFALKYLNMFTKSTPMAGRVVVSMSKDQPLKVYYKIADLGSVTFFLAPKVGDDEPAEQEQAETKKEQLSDDE